MAIIVKWVKYVRILILRAQWHKPEIVQHRSLTMKRIIQSCMIIFEAHILVLCSSLWENIGTSTDLIIAALIHLYQLITFKRRPSCENRREQWVENVFKYFSFDLSSCRWNILLRRWTIGSHHLSLTRNTDTSSIRWSRDFVELMNAKYTKNKYGSRKFWD